MESQPQELSTSDLSLQEALTEIQRLNGENVQLRSDLEECKDQLFDLLQKQNDIPEQAIKDTLIQITEGIDSWIDDVSGDERFDFKVQYQRNIQSQNRGQIFATLGTSTDLAWQTNMSKLGTCHYAVLSLVISHWVIDEVLLLRVRNRWPLHPFGLSESQAEVFQDVQLAMKSESDGRQRDVHRFAAWRKETITALEGMKEFEIQRDHHVKAVSECLYRDLEFWIGSKLLGEHIPALRRKVIEPSVKLLHMISCSSKQYGFSIPTATSASLSSDAGDYILRDIASWRTVNTKDVQGCITCLYPGIVRKEADGQDNSTLIKPVLLVYRNIELKPTALPPSGRLEKSTSDLARYDRKRSERDPTDQTRQSRSSRRHSPQKQPSSRSSNPEPRVQRPKMGATIVRTVSELFGVTSPAPVSPPASQSGQPRRQARTSTHPPRGHEHGDESSQEAWHRQSGSGDIVHYDTSTSIQQRVTIDPTQGPQGYSNAVIDVGYPYAQVPQWPAPQ